MYIHNKSIGFNSISIIKTQFKYKIHRKFTISKTEQLDIFS